MNLRDLLHAATDPAHAAFLVCVVLVAVVGLDLVLHTAARNRRDTVRGILIFAAAINLLALGLNGLHR